MKRMRGWSAVIFFLNLLTAPAQNGPTRIATPDFSWVAQTELPSAVAETIKSSKPSDREKVTIQMVKKAVRKYPACVIAIVGTAAHAQMEVASLVAGTAAKELPKQAALIAHAASAAAPSEVGSIVIAVCRAVPKEYRSIVLAAAQAVPGSSRQVLEALATALPELKAAINRALEGSAGNQVSVAGILDSVDLSLHAKSDPLTPIGQASTSGSGDRSRVTKPPFIPLSGNAGQLGSSPSTAGTDGGRNYSSP